MDNVHDGHHEPPAEWSGDLGFIGGAEIDRFGNLNTTYIGGRDHVQVRLPGSGGGSDIASLSRRLVIMMHHERRRFLEKVSYITFA